MKNADHSNAVRNTLGDEPAILGTQGRRLPDRRRVSMRWLSGTVLTGFSSIFLMGGALYAAFDGRETMTEHANTLSALNARSDQQTVIKGDRPTAIIAEAPKRERILQVPTMTQENGVGVVRKRPFAFVEAPLAVAGLSDLSYPAFNPLRVFSTSGASRTKATSSDVIYSADIEGEVRIMEEPFDIGTQLAFADSAVSKTAIERTVRAARARLINDTAQVTDQVYVDLARFSLEENPAPVSGLDIRIVAENESSRLQVAPSQISERYVERVVAMDEPQTLRAALETMEFEQTSMNNLLDVLIGEFGASELSAGTKLRFAYKETREDFTQQRVDRMIRRVSVYRGGQHLKTAALNDDDTVVWAAEPAPIPAVAADDAEPDLSVATVTSANLPTLYDGLYRAGLSQGLNKKQIQQIIQTVAFDVEFKKRIDPNDRLEVFHSLEEGQAKATDASEVLYIALTSQGVRRQYYRFRALDDGSVDYYDERGKSAKKFLLRKPVPNGKFRSPFGMRRHPISRVRKMHNGVDFSAPRGTPIVAAGNGIVEKIGWAGGYGRQIILRHANGYKTSYNHMHRFAKRSKKGARVRQGQIIGTVGSTGYSTGPHLHYEVLVNGRRVNPMKIRLPEGRSLSGKALTAFRQERDRIDALLQRAREPQVTVASAN
ncbi:MAG: M23 family metallopeptidase [Pseudomonadota bacterium]